MIFFNLTAASEVYKWLVLQVKIVVFGRVM